MLMLVDPKGKLFSLDNQKYLARSNSKYKTHIESVFKYVCHLSNKKSHSGFPSFPTNVQQPKTAKL